MGKGLLGGMFDFNGDGNLNAFEMAAECQFIHEVVLADDDSDTESDDLFGADGDGDDDY